MCDPRYNRYYRVVGGIFLTPGNSFSVFLDKNHILSVELNFHNPSKPKVRNFLVNDGCALSSNGYGDCAEIIGYFIVNMPIIQQQRRLNFYCHAQIPSDCVTLLKACGSEIHKLYGR